MTEPIHVLLIAADRHARALLVEVIEAAGGVRLSVVESPGEARILLNAYRYRLVIATNLGIAPEVDRRHPGGPILRGHVHRRVLG